VNRFELLLFFLSLSPQSSISADFQAPCHPLKQAGFRLAPDLEEALHNPELPDLMATVSTDRIREELAKAMKVNTWDMLKLLNRLPEPLVKNWLERPGMWLMPFRG
jgi:hypothetical protein